MKQWFKINNLSDSETEVLIYDEIGEDPFSTNGLSARDFAEKLASIPREHKIVLGINSPGGNVWDGLAIYHLISARADKVTARIDGVAASIASVIAMGAGKVVMPKSSLMMIHRAWGFAIGNADQMSKMAADLLKHDELIAGIYAKKTGKDDVEIIRLMNAETWFNGEEALSAGLADEVIDRPAIAACFDLTRYNFRNLPRQFQPRGAAGEGAHAPQNTTGKNMNDTKEIVPAPAASNTSPAPDFTKQLKDEIISAVKAAMSPPPGAEPVRVRVENLGNPLIEAYNNEFDIVKKAALARSHYNEVRKQLMLAKGISSIPNGDRFDFGNEVIRNANTVDSALANTVLAGEFVSVMRTYIAPWSAFTRVVSPSPVSRRQTLEVPLFSSSGSKQQNATNYETGDTTLAPIAVTVAEESKSFHVSRPEQNLGLQLAGFIPTNARILAEGIHAKMTGLMTTGNFGAGQVIGVAANFDAADLPAILAIGKNYDSVRLLLDGGHLAYLLPTSRESFQFGEPGAYGFDGGIYKNNLWTGAATNTCGFLCGPDAIVNAFGQAEGLPTGEFLSQEKVDVNGIPFTLSVWFSRSTRFVWGSIQIMHGCAVGDATQGKILVTA